MSLATELAVRWVHVVAASLLLGGSGLTWVTLRTRSGRRGRARGGTTLRVAAGYEWLFWLAVGLLAVTGVGNLGAMAPAVPTSGPWPATLAAKLLLLVALLLGSAWRTLLVVRLRATAGVASDPRERRETRADGGRLDARSRSLLRRSYAATALVLGVLLALAEVLAHG